MQLTAKNNKEMEKIGQELAGRLKGGDILCLEGNLGAGKTTLVKGLARGFNIKDNITSPTFALMNIYNIRTTCLPAGRRNNTNIRNLIHIDTYRLKNEEELLDIGAEDYLGKPDTICVIEWPEKIKGLLKNIHPQPKAGRARRIGLESKKIINVKIEYHNGDQRIVTIN